MHLPWFMHCHGGQNTMVGVLPTPSGTYVRSWKDGFFDVSWYPMGSEYAGGESRRMTSLGRFTDDETRPIGESEQAVIDHMHAHPVLSLTTSYDPRIEPIVWERAVEGVSTHIAPEGTWLRIQSGGFVVLSLLPEDGRPQIEIAKLSDACSEASLEKRVAERVRRHRDDMAARAAA
jgi:hypothetical protein